MHTEEPWHLSLAGRGNRIVSGNTSWPTGAIATVDQAHTHEGRANATLIAAAPTLLEACRAALQFGIVGPGALELVEQLRRAIALAEGTE